MTRQLWSVGITEVFADGSFVEEKDHPHGVDGYFVCALQELANGELARKLNLLDPHKVWTWDPQSRQFYRGYPKRQLPMWHGTGWSSIRTSPGSSVAFVIRRVTSSSFLPPFANHAVTVRRAASSS